jgi:KUP system potassium uptake protein
MLGTLLVVIMFRTSDALASAYGIAVSGTMMVTTMLLYRVAVGEWKWPPIVAGLVIALFAGIEAIFLVSNSLKIVEGGWFPLLIGGVIAALMLSWPKGSLEVRRRLYEMSMLPLDRFLTYVDDLAIGRAPGLGVWLTKVEHGASPMLIRHLQHNRVFHERVALLSSCPIGGRACRSPSGTMSRLSAMASIGFRSGLASGKRPTSRGLCRIFRCWASFRSRTQALLPRT